VAEISTSIRAGRVVRLQRMALVAVTSPLATPLVIRGRSDSEVTIAGAAEAESGSEDHPRLPTRVPREAW